MSDNSKHASRREYLKFVGTASGIYGITGTALGQSGSSVRLPILKRGDEVVESREFPTSWWEHYQRAKKKKNKLLRQIEMLEKDTSNTKKQTDMMSTTSLEIGDSQFGGLPGFRIHAEVRSSAVRDALTDSVDGISVRVSESPMSGPASCPGRGTFNPTTGGVEVHSDVSSDSRGSTTTEVKYNGNNRLMTAAHLWGDCSVQIGDPASVDGGTNKIGEVSTYDKGRDFVLIDNEGNPKYANEVRDYNDSFDTWTRKPVDGYVAEAGVGSLMINNTIIYQVGSTTGETDGYLTNTGLGSSDIDSSCVDFAGEGIKGDYTNAEGDSGGPVYHTEDGNAYMISPYLWWFANDETYHSCGTNNRVGTDGGAGTAAWEIHDHWGIKWNT
jgi:hypothetical protein